MAISDDISDALGELIEEFGETVTWRPYDGTESHSFSAYVTGNTVIVLKSTVTALSPNRAPENGDTIISSSGSEAQVESVNGAFDQVISGGFSVQPSLRAGGQVFYRIICSADIGR